MPKFVTETTPFRSTAELEASIDSILDQSPKTAGTVERIITRPADEEREVPESVQLTVASGVSGDHWVRDSWQTRPDGSSDPKVQIAAINSRLVDFISFGDRERWGWAGDQLYLDIDMRPENLSPGTRLQIGAAVVEVTPFPHTSCQKFSDRYGVDVFRFTCTPDGLAKNLRGVHLRVIEDGEVRLGDAVRKCE